MDEDGGKVKKGAGCGCTVMAIALTIFGTAAVATVGSHFDREVYTATVKGKERVNDRTSSKYLIFTELGDGTGRVFENTDSPLELKFNSSDIYGKIEVGKTYKIKTYGWRIPFLSAYENILSIEEENSSDKESEQEDEDYTQPKEGSEPLEQKNNGIILL